MNAFDGLEVVPRAAVAATDWDALVETSPAGWPFALYAWQDMITGIEEWALADHSVAVREHGRLCAVLPLQFNVGGRVLASSGWGGSGPVCAAGLAPRRLKRVLDCLFAHVDAVASALAATRFEFWLSPVTRLALAADRGVNPYVFHGCEDCSTLAQVLRLDVDEDSLWRGLSESARQAVNKARALGITVERADWQAHLDSYYAMHCANYARTGVAAHPRAYFAGIASVLGSRNLSTLWVARAADGTPLAYHNSLGYAVGAWYHTGCSVETALANGSNYLLFWHALLGARAAGRQWYDCGEIDPSATQGKRAGLSTFKRKFGGTVHRFLKCARVYSPQTATLADSALPPTGRWRTRLRRWMFESESARRERS